MMVMFSYFVICKLLESNKPGLQVDKVTKALS